MNGMDDEHDTPVDPALAEVWEEMSPEERIRLLLVEGECPPPEVREAAREMFRERQRENGEAAP